MSTKILDISKYQPTVDYAACAKDIDGVILRIGLTYWGVQNMGKDETFEQHYAGFKAQGTPIGIYYYSCADSIETATAEANYVLDLLKGKQFELPIYYDVENNERQGALSKEALTAITDTFCSIVQKAGYFVGYYSYTAWLLSKFDTAYLSSKYSLWKADYRTSYDTSIPCDMHQYTSSGAVSGIGSRVDLNHCYRDFEKEIKAAGLNGFEPQTVTPSTFIPSLLKIGLATGNDITAISNLLDELKITFNVIYETIGGYIYTEVAPSEGDYNSIKELCDSLGIPCVSIETAPTPSTEVEELQAELAEVKALAEKYLYRAVEAEKLLEAIKTSILNYEEATT